MSTKTFLLALTFFLPLTAQAQISRLADNIEYEVKAEGTAGSGDAAPFWFTSNKYGLGSNEPNSALLRASIQRSAKADSLHSWHFGYGLDIVGAVNHEAAFVLQQAYLDIQYKVLELSIGQKERPLELRDQQLSTGGMTTGINARPIPQVRLGLHEFWNIPGTRKWLGIKGHIAYGMFTDNNWQKENAGTSGHRAADVLFHSKAFFIRVGNEEKFPLTLTLGIEASAQFGGEVWNVTKRADDTSDFDANRIDMPNELKDFWNVLLMTGSDYTDGDYPNASGNQLGSWHIRLDFNKGGWGLSYYMEHFFEDSSQSFLCERWTENGSRKTFRQYNLKDMLYGAEMRLPRNRFLTAIVYEHLRTTDQSGPIYHNSTSILEDQVTGIDNYYNHGIYTGWHHAGYAIGNPLLLSPIYNDASDGIKFMHNRIVANHFGLRGDPTDWLGYRIMMTQERSLGSYETPLTDPAKGNFLLVEGTYRPTQVPGLSLTLSYGQNHGELLGQSRSAMLTVSYSGMFNRKRK